MEEFEDIIIQFVKERLPDYKWKYLTNRSAIERTMEDDDVEEIKEEFFRLAMNRLKWNTITDEIYDMQIDIEEEDCKSTDTEYSEE